MDNDKSLRKHIVALLTEEHAHAGFDSAVKDLPPQLRGVRPEGAQHSPWELLEHIRLGQWDILEFTRDANHVSPKWPEGYWPATPAPPSDKAWDESVENFRRDLRGMVALVEDESLDLVAKIPHGTGQTILREALLAADHNAYHIGQLVIVRRLLGAWG
jgi:hypothetical protein